MGEVRCIAEPDVRCRFLPFHSVLIVNATQYLPFALLSYRTYETYKSYFSSVFCRYFSKNSATFGAQLEPPEAPSSTSMAAA